MLKDDKPHGLGFLYESTGRKYFGQMQNGQKHGLGTVYIESKGSIEQEFVDNEPLGYGIQYQGERTVVAVQYYKETPFASMTLFHGLGIITESMDEKKYILFEKNKPVKGFDSKEVSKILSGELDYTMFFQNREKSTRKLEKILRGRPKSLGFVPPEGFKENMKKIKRELQDMRDKYDIEDPHPREYKKKKSDGDCTVF